MQLHTIKRKTKNKKKVSVGRGGKRGKTSGRGTKGQNARAGRKKRPEMRDIIKKIPKLRGYSFNSISEKNAVISLSKIAEKFLEGEAVTPKSLVEKGLVKERKGVIPKVKILFGNKEFSFSKKINFENIKVSSNVRSVVEKAGGTIK